MNPSACKSTFYPILDSDSLAKYRVDRDYLLSMWQELGADWVQIRNKSGTDKEVLESARWLKERFPSIRVILNDRWELALAHRDLFFGLHLGQEDVDALGRADRERIAASGLVLGHSTHRPEQTAKACRQSDLPWSYVAVGPCFPTSSKPGGKDPVLSSEQIVQLTRTIFEAGLTAVWIGGLNKEKTSELRQILSPKGLWTARRGVVSLISGAMDRSELAAIKAECELTEMASPSHGT